MPSKVIYHFIQELNYKVVYKLDLPIVSCNNFAGFALQTHEKIYELPETGLALNKFFEILMSFLNLDVNIYEQWCFQRNISSSEVGL